MFPPQGSSADEITNTPSGSISATNLQTAINELDTEKASLTQIAGGYPAIAFHATTMDIFAIAGTAKSISGTGTLTALPNCPAALVGMPQTIIPSDAAGFSITASASLVVDGATSGTYLMPQSANIQIIATSTSTFKITTIEAHGTWTPSFTSLTLGGTAPTLTGQWFKSGRLVTFNVILTSGGGGNTTACVAGTTFINNVPLSASVRSALVAVSDHVTLVGVAGGTINSNQVYPPAWSATANGKDISWQAII